jgi:hypothetical protein
MDTRPQISDEQVLAALAIVATPEGAAALLAEWLERVVTPAEVSQVIAGSEKLQRVTAFCRSMQEPTSATDDFEARVRSMGGIRRWRDRRCRK